MATKTYPILLFGAIGFAFGIGLLLFDVNATEASSLFIQTSEFAVWLVLICVSCVVMFTTPFILFDDLRKLWQNGRSHYLDLGISIFLVTLLYLIPVLFSRGSAGPAITFPLAHHNQKINILYGLGFFSTLLPATLAIWLIRQALLDEFQAGKIDTISVRRFNYYRDRLQRSIMILGILVSLVTLDTGALRSAVIASGNATPEQFPVIAVLIYGAYFTILLIFLYLPAYNTCRDAGREIREAYVPFPGPDDPDWDKALARRKALDEALQIQLSAKENLQTSVLILAPMLSGIISFLLQ